MFEHDVPVHLVETLAVFDDASVPGTPLTAQDVAAALDCGPDAASKRLDALVERGVLATRDVGDGERVWWRPRESSTDDAAAAVGESVEAGRGATWYEAVLESVDDGVYVVDDDGEFVWCNDAYADILGYDREEIVGSDLSFVANEAVVGDPPCLEWEPKADDADSTTLRAELRTVDGDRVPIEGTFSVFHTAEGMRRVGVVRDVTDRKQFEETLTALNDSSRRLLAAETADEVSAAVVDTATEVLDLPSVIVYRHDEDQGRLYPDARSVDAGFMREEFPVVPTDESSITGRVFVDGEPHHYDDVRDAPELQVNRWNTEMRAGLFAPMGDHGVLVVGSRAVDTFDDDIRQLVEILAANAEATYDRVEREEQFKRQRERLTALNNLSAVVRDINEALVQQSTRTEVEDVVCERLAASDSYQFAWVGEVDSTSEEVRLRTESGVEGYLDDVSISTDPDDPSGLGPTGRAVRTHDVQVVRGVQEDESYERWHDHAREYGYRSSAAIPIVHGGTLYGVLNVYTGRRDAFTGEERTVVAQLGEIVGHAIASVDRKQALMGDQVVEVEFLARDVLDPIDALDSLDASATDVRVNFDRAVPTGDDEFLVYGTATSGSTELLEALVDHFPDWSALTVLGEDESSLWFELRFTEPPVFALVADSGGNIEWARIEDGDYRMLLHLPPSTDIRRVVDDVREVFPSAEMLSRRQIAQDDESLPHLRTVLTDELTDRQRAALEVAYLSGFFEWPRNSSGEEIADSIGISHPTFSEHLRLAQQKLFDALFSEPSGDAD